MRKSRIPLFATLGILVFFYLPIIVLVANSFNESRYGGSWDGFSMKWYAMLFDPQFNRGIWPSVVRTLIVACGATLASTVLGTAAAFALYRFKSKLQRAHYGLIYTPLVVPEILMGISCLLFFLAIGQDLGLFTIFIAHTTFCISYVAMVVLARFQDFDFAVIEAAQDLGANWWQTTWRVVLPLLAPGIAAGALLAFTLSIDDFVITSFVAGPGSNTLPMHIYSMIKFSKHMPMINALSVLLLVVTFAAVWFSQRLTREKQKS